MKNPAKLLLKKFPDKKNPAKKQKNMPDKNIPIKSSAEKFAGGKIVNILKY